MQTPQRVNQLQPRRLVLLEVDQEIGESLRIGALVQPAINAARSASGR